MPAWIDELLGDENEMLLQGPVKITITVKGRHAHMLQVLTHVARRRQGNKTHSGAIARRLLEYGVEAAYKKLPRDVRERAELEVLEAIDEGGGATSPS